LPLWLVPGTLNGVWWETALTLIVMLAMILVCERACVREAEQLEEQVPRELATT
jgi:ABC-type enterobactin transport system permease subunit